MTAEPTDVARPGPDVARHLGREDCKLLVEVHDVLEADCDLAGSIVAVLNRVDSILDHVVQNSSQDDPFPKENC